MHDVTVTAPGFCTPRMVMHMCLCKFKTRQRLHIALDRTNGVNVRRFHYDRDAAGLDRLFYGEGDLLCQSLLHLQPAAERLGNPGEFGKPKDQFVRDVGNRNLNIVRRLPKMRDRGTWERTLPVNGTRWCSHKLDISMSRTRTISSWSSSKTASLMMSASE